MRPSTAFSLGLLTLTTSVLAQIPRTTGGSLTIPSSIPNQMYTPPLVNTATGIDYCTTMGLNLPDCAFGCIGNAAPEAGCTNALEIGCLCNEFVPLLALAEQCVVTSCGLALGLIVQSSVTEICDCAKSFPSAVATQTPGPQMYITVLENGATSVSTGTVIPYGNAATRNVGGWIGAFLGLVAAL